MFRSRSWARLVRNNAYTVLMQCFVAEEENLVCVYVFSVWIRLPTFEATTFPSLAF